ncbi:hypothetical protein Tco_1129692 [Tanacetum coccineum]
MCVRSVSIYSASLKLLAPELHAPSNQHRTFHQSLVSNFWPFDQVLGFTRIASVAIRVMLLCLFRELLHFVEEGHDMFYVATYNKYGLENHAYKETSLMFWRCLLRVTKSMKQNMALQLEKRVYPPSGSQTVDLLYGDEWRNMMEELDFQPGHLFAFTLLRRRCFILQFLMSRERLLRKVIPSDIVKTYKLYGYASAIVTNRDAQYEFELRWGKVSNSLEIYSSPILRKMKEMTGFMADQWAHFYLTEGTSLKDGVIRLDVC